MNFDTAKMTPEDKAAFDELAKRYAVEEPAPTTDPAPTTEAAPSQPETDDVYKGLHPAVKAELESLRKFREESEMRRYSEIAKKYTLLGKKPEELAVVLKSLNDAGGTAYADMIGLLYNVGQDSSTTPIAAAKAYLEDKGVAYKEYTGTTVDEIILAAQAAAADGVDAVFTPTDNTVMTAELSIYELLAEAGVPHYTGADSFALNGAFLGYGVDYANLGVETADMVAEILLEGKAPASLAVKTFDNGTATVNTETCTALGLDYDTVAATFAPYCTKVQPITTAESFE